MLLHALRWAHEHPAAQVEVALLRGGPLVEEYRTLVDTSVQRAYLGAGQQMGAAIRAIGLGRGAPVVPRLHVGRAGVVDVVVANTLASLAPAARLARRSAARLVCWVHELDGVAQRLLPRAPSERATLLAAVDSYGAAGVHVAAMLVERLSVDPARVRVVEPFVVGRAPDAQEVAAARARLCAAGEVLVVASGSLIRRKGPERFVDLVRELRTHTAPLRAVWVGGDPSSVVGREMRSDIDRAGLGGTVDLVPAVPDVLPVLAAADVVVSTAIEDPYPLVTLEAAMSGATLAGFDSGGIGDVLRACGQGDAAVPIGDVLGLATVVGRLIDEPVERQDRGRRVADWVTGTHLVEHGAPRFWELVLG